MSHRIKSGVAWAAFSRGVGQALSLASGAILARLIAPSEFGVIAMTASCAGVAALLQLHGFGSALVQKQDATEAHKSSLFWLNLGVGLLLAALMASAAPWLGEFFGNAKVTPVTRLVALTFVVSSLGAVHSALLTKRMSFKVLGLVELTSALAGSICAIALALAGRGVWSLAWQLVVKETCLLLLIWRAAGWRPRFLFRLECLREMLSFSGYLQASSLLRYANQNLDNLLIGKFLGSSSLAFYDRAYQLMRFPQANITQVVSRVFFPAFAKVQHDHAHIRDMFLRASRQIALAAIPLGVLFVVTAPEIIGLLYGQQWQRSAFLFQILALVGVNQSLAFFGAIYLSQGRTDTQFRMRLLALAILVPAFIIGLRWDIEGVAIGYALANVLGSLPTQMVALRLVGLRLRTYYRNLLPIAFSAAMMAGIVWVTHVLLTQNSLPALAILACCAAVGGLSYLACLRLLAPTELNELARFIKEIVHHAAENETTKQGNTEVLRQMTEPTTKVAE